MFEEKKGKKKIGVKSTLKNTELMHLGTSPICTISYNTIEAIKGNYKLS
jgi:hypothetical protein